MTESESILAIVRGARDVPHGTRFDVEIAAAGEHVPAILLVPASDAPVPAALLLHGLGSRKERMADTIGVALIARGVAALAVDLPLHGGRDGELLASGDPVGANPLRLIATWRRAIEESRAAVGYLEAHPAVDSQRLGLVGYSLGSFLANIVAGDLASVRAVVLAASGDLPDGMPFQSLVRTIVDPLRAVRRAAGRPLLMLNGRFDRTVMPPQAERLFAAAYEPKTMRWYGGGHWPPAGEIAFAAEWLSQRLRSEDDRERGQTA